MKDENYYKQLAVNYRKNKTPLVLWERLYSFDNFTTIPELHCDCDDIGKKKSSRTRYERIVKYPSQVPVTITEIRCMDCACLKWIEWDVPVILKGDN